MRRVFLTVPGDFFKTIKYIFTVRKPCRQRQASSELSAMKSLYFHILFFSCFPGTLKIPKSAILVFIIGISCIISSFGQGFTDPRLAKDFFKHKNYKAAIPELEKLIKQEPDEPENYHRLGICYLRTNIDKSKAISPLERAIKFAKVDREAYFDLGYAYQLNYKFDEAIKMYKKYKPLESDISKAAKADRQIETCITARELMKHPVEVKFQNLGKEINSEYADYYPFVAKDESYFVFTSRRKGNIGGEEEFDGLIPSDIWITEKAAKAWGKAKNAGSIINTSYDEQAVGLSDDAKSMFIYIDHIDKFGDIYISERRSKSFQKSVKLGNNVNSSSLETSASISEDGYTLFFSSAMAGGYGGLDLYMCKKLPDGEWALPQNLGPQINTRYNEDFPTLSSDGHTLYFCSEGHSSMGGYDIFTSLWDEEDNFWIPPQNIGYPLNTPDDERVISFSENKSVAYVSAFRKEGFGDLDIYKVTFKDAGGPLLAYQFKLTDKYESFLTLDAKVLFLDETMDLVGTYQPNPNTGIYTAILSPGKYTLSIETSRYQPVKSSLSITSADCKKGPIRKDILLLPKK